MTSPGRAVTSTALAGSLCLRYSSSSRCCFSNNDSSSLWCLQTNKHGITELKMNLTEHFFNLFSSNLRSTGLITNLSVIRLSSGSASLPKMAKGWMAADECRSGGRIPCKCDHHYQYMYPNTTSIRLVHYIFKNLWRENSRACWQRVNINYILSVMEGRKLRVLKYRNFLVKSKIREKKSQIYLRRKVI